MSFDKNLPGSDARPLTTVELLTAVQAKFAGNFETSKSVLFEAEKAEEYARSFTRATEHLQLEAGIEEHRLLLSTYIDEIFGDSVSALYLASCGLQVPARMLLRRSLELALALIAYWDAPTEFWQWREHDGDIKFSELFATLSSAGYTTFLKKIPNQKEVMPVAAMDKISALYSDLSNVIHPKPYNFSTKFARAYDFNIAEFRITIDFAERSYSQISSLLSSRFPKLELSNK